MKHHVDASYITELLAVLTNDPTNENVISSSLAENLLNKLDRLGFVIVKKPTTKNNSTPKLRIRFEHFANEYLANGNKDFTAHACDGGYKNSKCESAWASFHKAAGLDADLRREIKESSLKESNNYIIGSHDKHKRLKFSPFPQIHRGREKAIQEATRLAERFDGTKFFLFAMTGPAIISEKKEEEVKPELSTYEMLSNSSQSQPSNIEEVLCSQIST